MRVRVGSERHRSLTRVAPSRRPPASWVPQGRTPLFRTKQASTPFSTILCFSFHRRPESSSLLARLCSSQGGGVDRPSPDQPWGSPPPPPYDFIHLLKVVQLIDCFSQFLPNSGETKLSLISSIAEFPQLPSLWTILPHPRWGLTVVFPPLSSFGSFSITLQWRFNSIIDACHPNSVHVVSFCLKWNLQHLRKL
jgi:hypothetical protein